MTDEERMRDSLVRYLNGHDSLEELILSHDIVKCPQCQHYVLEDELVSHKWDLNDSEEKICLDCRGDEE